MDEGYMVDVSSWDQEISSFMVGQGVNVEFSSFDEDLALSAGARGRNSDLKADSNSIDRVVLTVVDE